MYATSPDAVRIHYEVLGEGPPLVLHHGFSDSLERWHASGVVAALRDTYRLVLFDARGHGASDKPTDPDAYSLDTQVADVLAILDDLGLASPHYLGYSMGGRVGFGLASQAPTRVQRLILGGAHPYRQSLASFREALRRGIEGWVEVAEKTAGPLFTEEDKARMRANDLRALQACVAHDRPDLSPLLPTISMPCLLFAGANDPICDQVQRAAGELPHGVFYRVPDMNHTELAFRIDAVLPLVRQFLLPSAG